MYNAADSMIRAFQLGLAERRAAQDQAAEEDRRKIEMDLLQHRIKQMKLEERIKTWDMNVKGAQAEAAAFEGLPEAEMASAGRLRGVPARDLSQTVAGLMPSAPGQMTGTPLAAGPPPAALAAVRANQPLAVAPVMQPGFQDAEAGIDVAAVPIRVKTREQQIADARTAAQLKAESEPYTLNAGQRRFVGGQQIAAAPEDPMEARRVAVQEKANKLGWAQLNFQIEKETDLVRKGVGQWLSEQLVGLEEKASPDAKSLAVYEESWDEDQQKHTRPLPTPRLTPKQKETQQLQLVNSARRQLGMKSFTKLPPDPGLWLPLGENMAPAGMVRMQAPDGTISDVAESMVAHYKARGATVIERPTRR